MGLAHRPLCAIPLRSSDGAQRPDLSAVSFNLGSLSKNSRPKQVVSSRDDVIVRLRMHPINKAQLLSTIACVMEDASSVQQTVLGYQQAASLNWISEQLDGVDFYEQGLLKFRGEPQSERALILLALERTLEKKSGIQLATNAKPPAIVAGDLEVQGDLQLTDSLLVLGDLIVHGTMRDSAPYSYLGITGDLQCKALVTSGEITVFGNANIGYWQGVGNNHSFVVGGDMSCDILFQDEHDIYVVGNRQARIDAHLNMAVDDQLELLNKESPLFHVDMETENHNGEYKTSAFIDAYVK